MGLQLIRTSALTLTLLVGFGCRAETDRAALPYTLSCDSADTELQATPYCVRTDTRNGDIVRVNIDQLTISRGSTKAMSEAEGTYQTECVASNTPTRADFRCLRLHRGTGEIILVRLSEVPVVPIPSAP